MRLVIENTYACGRQSSAVIDLVEPLWLDENWWQEVAHPLTGDGHPCGSSEHAMYTVTIADADHTEWVGVQYTWEG